MKSMYDPIPCIYVSERTIRDWFAKLDSEVNEFKEAVLRRHKDMNADLSDGVNNSYLEQRIAEERADVVTVLTSMLRAAGISDDVVRQAQEQVNRSNHIKGSW